MKLTRTIAFAILILTGLGQAHAADLVGKWTAEFETQIGIQKYVYEFKAAGDKFTGKATFERTTGNGAVELKDITLKGDDIFFAEPLEIDGNEITITYAGKLTGDEMKLTRTVGDFATEQVVVKRAKTPEPKPASTKQAQAGL